MLKLDAPGKALRALSGYPAALPKAFSGVDNCESHPIFDKLGIAPDIRFIFDNHDVALEHLTASRSWALLPCWIVRANRDKVAWILPKGWEAPVFASALWPKNRPMTKVLRRLIARLEGQFAALPV